MPSSSRIAQTSSGARSANRALCSASRIACRSAGASARGWTRSACGTGAAFGGGGLVRCRRYQVACGTPAAAQAARVPILRREQGDRLVGHDFDPGSVSALSEIVSKLAI